MFLLGNNKDKFGFYQVGDRRTYSKMEAIDLHQHTGTHPHWNFNEEFFSSYDWTVEPTEDLETLYARRAQQIRDTYDYIVLAYSGGIDSQNILDSFVNNNIKIDEVLTYSTYESHKDPDHCDVAELINVAWPKLKQLQDQGVEFKHRYIDLTDRVLAVLQNPEFKLDRAYYAATNFGSIHLSMTDLRSNEPDYARILESDKKLVFVWGSDKPRIYYENGRYCLKFIDFTDSGVRARTQMLNRENEYDELFYWSPESVDMICKQGHVLKNFFKRCYKFETSEPDNLINIGAPVKPWVNEQRGYLDLPDELQHLHNFSPLELVNWLIYKDHNPATLFSVGKPKSRLLSTREIAFNSDESVGLHTRYLVEKIKSIDTYWWTTADNVYGGVKNCVSPGYYLE